MSSGVPTSSVTAKHASLKSWHTMRPRTSPGASPTHATCRPRLVKNASARSAATPVVVALRVSSTRVAPSSGGSAWKPPAPPPGSRACSEPSTHSTASGPPCSGGSSSSAPQSITSHGTSPTAPSGSHPPHPAPAPPVDHEPRHLAHGPERLDRRVPGARRQTAQLLGQRQLAGDHDEPPLAAARRRRLGVVGAVRAVAVLVPAAPRLAPVVAGGDELRLERRGPPARLGEAAPV